MKEIKYTRKFKQDYKREKKSHKVTLERELKKIVRLLANNKPLPRKYCDHSLMGEWKDHRDCHIRPNLVLIYRNNDSLELVRLGSHSKLSL